MPKPGFVVLRVERPRSVEIDPGSRVDTTHGYQLERQRIRLIASFQGVIQRLGDECADAEASCFSCAAYLFCKLVVKGDRDPHDEHHNVYAEAL